MKANSRLTAILLFLTILVGIPAAWALEFPSTTAVHPAGCHDSMPETPSPSPADHECCVSGHDWAVTVSAPILHLIVQQIRAVTESHNLQLHLCSDRPLAVVSDSPPVTTSLRI
jgi:hypothetical protein